MTEYEICIGKKHGYDGDSFWSIDELQSVMIGIKYIFINGITMIGRSYVDKNCIYSPYKEECVKILTKILNKEDMISLVKKLCLKLKQDRIYVFDKELTYIFIDGEIKVGKTMKKIFNIERKKDTENIIFEIQYSRSGQIQIPITINRYNIEFRWFCNIYPEKYELLTEQEFEKIVEIYKKNINEKLLLN